MMKDVHLKKLCGWVAGIFFITAMLVHSAQTGRSYYVSSLTGDDANSGHSPESAWKSLEQVSRVEFKPGDSLLLESGSVFKGQLLLNGSGFTPDAELDSIIIDRYGEGSLPRIDGEGLVDAAVLLYNAQGIEVRNLEVTNTGTKRKRNRYGVVVHNDRLAAARSIHLKNLYVHDVNGAYPKDQNAGGGILFRVDHDGENRVYCRFDDISVENCHIKDCSRDGIRIHGGTSSRADWNPSTRVVIRNNLIEGVGGDGIVPVGCDGALVEWNTMRDCPRYGEEGGAAAGMWPWSSDNSVFQFNEVSGHKAWVDAQAYDCDYNCNNTLYQYNYSYDNEGGFMLLCSPGKKNGNNARNRWLVGNEWNKGSVVRYNLSINDGSRTQGGVDYFSPTFSITGETTQDSQIYRNLVILPLKADPQMDNRVLEFGNWGGKYPVNTRIRENVFIAEPGQRGSFDFGKARKVLLEDNFFYGDFAEIQETGEVESRGDLFDKERPPSVPIRGTKEDLKVFYEFLKTKGNPHEQRGVRIQWVLEK